MNFKSKLENKHVRKQQKNVSCIENININISENDTVEENRSSFTAPNSDGRHKKKSKIKTHHCKINTFISPFRI